MTDMRNVNCNIWKNISDKEYITGLKGSDNRITESFFYGLCSYTLNDIRFSLMQNMIEYDELVNELYIYLSKDNWHKLDTFAGLNGCSLCSWMVRLAWRFFMSRRERLLGATSVSVDDVQIEDVVDSLDMEIAMDVETTLSKMKNERYVKVLKWMLVNGLDAEEVANLLNTSIPNVYNIKHRAIVQFVEIYNA